MASAEEYYQAWRGHFETDAWRAEATGSMRAVSAFYCHWACDGAIEWPAMENAILAARSIQRDREMSTT